MKKYPIEKICNLIILDESGSMEKIKNKIIKGFNELLVSISQSAEENPGVSQWINMYSFNGSAIKELIPLSVASDRYRLDEQNYWPISTTPLYDAIWYAINNIEKALSRENRYTMLVTILTDGQDNASREVTLDRTQRLVRRKKKHGWVFTYIGTNHSVSQTAIDLNISNHLHFSLNEPEVMFEKNEIARKQFISKIINFPWENLEEGFFDALNPGETAN